MNSSSSAASSSSSSSPAVDLIVRDKTKLVTDLVTSVPQLQRNDVLGGSRDIDILAFVVNDNEWQAAIRYVSIKGTVLHGSQTYYYGVLQRARLILVRQLYAGAGGSGRSQDVVSDALKYWTPRCAVCIGVAFGFNSEAHEIGDVLVSECIFPYEHARVQDVVKLNALMTVQIGA